MHFHLPKPLHGWRELAGEVGIIVIGVLIALGAEQVVEEWRWNQKVAVVRKSLMGELANDRARWEFDMVTAKCANRQIDKLDLWAQAGVSSTPPRGVSVKPGDFFWMHSANWNLATGSQTLDHFPIDEQLAFASLYDGIAHRQVDIVTASDLGERVQGLIPVATDAEGRRQLRAALGMLKMRIAALTSNNAYMTRHFDAVGVKPDRSDFSADIHSLSCG